MDKIVISLSLSKVEDLISIKKPNYRVSQARNEGDWNQ